ncbi:MAG: Zn-ribbon domain-containing OB-fold protein [Candidatus Heimdallarchaeaceae archaeon]
MQPPKIWRERKARYLGLGVECLDCNQRNFPYQNHCHSCGSENVREYRLPEKGIVKYFTKVTIAPEEMKQWAPYVIGIIELEDGTKVTGQIVDCNYEEIEEDMKVRMTFRMLSQDGNEGLIRYGFKFVPI